VALLSQTEVNPMWCPLRGTFHRVLALFPLACVRIPLVHVVAAVTLRVRASDLWVCPGRPGTIFWPQTLLRSFLSVEPLEPGGACR